MKEYTITVLVRKPGGTYAFGPHEEGPVTAVNFDEAYSMVKEAVEAKGWEVDRPLSFNWKPCTSLGEEGEKA